MKRQAQNGLKRVVKILLMSFMPLLVSCGTSGVEGSLGLQNALKLQGGEQQLGSSQPVTSSLLSTGPQNAVQPQATQQQPEALQPGVPAAPVTQQQGTALVQQTGNGMGVNAGFSASAPYTGSSENFSLKNVSFSSFPKNLQLVDYLLKNDPTKSLQ